MRHDAATQHEEIRGWINGEPLHVDRRWFDAVDPATGAVTGRVQEATPDDVDHAVARARAALHGPWGRTSVLQRAALMERVADAIDARRAEFLHAEMLDTGKPIRFASAVDIPRGAANFRTFASLARALGDEAWHTVRDDVRALNYTERSPVGVIGVICPWNLPLLLLTWKVAPALLMGNTVVVKPSEETPRTATLLGSVFRDVGVPDGVYNVLHGFGPDSVGQAIVRHPGIDALTFTGETATGRRIQADAAPGLKALSFELGGKNAAVVFDDCDFDRAIEGTVRSVFSNCGQVCLCSERVLVHRSLFDRFVARLAEAADTLRMGAPSHADTQLGPLIHHGQRERVEAFVQRAIASGATRHTRSTLPPLEAALTGGSWTPPVVLTGLPRDHEFLQREVFGPVCHVAPFDDEAEAIEAANDSDYGLCAAVWTGNLDRAHRVARSMRTGIVWVNDWFLRDLRTPFGGVGISGIGREGGVRSFDFYSEIKNVCIRLRDA